VLLGTHLASHARTCIRKHAHAPVLVCTPLMLMHNLAGAGDGQDGGGRSASAHEQGHAGPSHRGAPHREPPDRLPSDARPIPAGLLPARG